MDKDSSGAGFHDRTKVDCGYGSDDNDRVNKISAMENSNDEKLHNEIDKLVKLKEVLKDSEEKYRKLTMFIQDAIIMLDNDGRIVNWNRAAEKIFGYSYKEVEGKSFHPLVVPQEHIGRAEENFQKFKHTGEGRFINKVTELHALRKDGTSFIAEVSISAVKIKGTMHAVGIVRDITERRQTQKKLLDAMEAAETANKAKSQFLANISHEIRTPMNGIIGFLDLLAQTPLNSQQEDYIREIKTASDSLLGLMNDLLDFSKIEANKMELEQIDFSIQRIMEEVTSSFSLRAYSKGIEIFTRIDNQIPAAVNGDPGKLRQVLENLISNAVKFTQKGEVVITAQVLSQTEDDINIVFGVTDSGIGISEGDRKKLFEPFTQVDASTTRKYGGTGLGLSICERLVNMMSGNITVDSKAGQGSTFSFNAIFHKAAILQEECDTEESLRGLRILVACESVTNRGIIRYYLEEVGCIISEAVNGEEAYELLSAGETGDNRVRMVILDSELPDCSGLDLAGRIKADPKQKDLIVNLLTHYVNPCDKELAGKQGISELVMKPVYKKDLLQSVLASLGISHKKLTNQLEDKNAIITFSEMEKNETRLLLVEDNATNQKLAASIFKMAGLSFDIAENGYEAIDALKRNKYSLVLMDCQMPEMDGYEATRLIRLGESVIDHTIIIAMTANVMKSDIDQCLEAGMDDYISKPFKANELLEIIAKWLKQRSNAMANNNDIEKNSTTVNNNDIDKNSTTVENRGNEIVLPDEPDKKVEAEIAQVLDQLSLEQMIDRSVIYEIYNEFVDMLPDSLRKIQDGIDANNFTEITISAHTLKGASATLHLEGISKIAAEIEKQGKAKNIQLCRIFMDMLVEYSKSNIRKVSH